MRRASGWWMGCVALTMGVGCSDPAPPQADAGPADGAAPDGPVLNCEADPEPRVSFYPSTLFVPVGGRTTVSVRIHRDRCAPLTLPATASPGGVVTAGASVSYTNGQSSASLEITGVAAGEGTVTVGGVSLPVQVVADTVPACPEATPAVDGQLMAGATVRGAAGSPLAQASIGLPAAAREVTARAVQIGCAAAQVPEGFVPVGPAVRFGPGEGRITREYSFAVPVNAARIPTGYEFQVEFVYTGPSVRTPRVVPVADVHLSTDGRAVQFRAPRLGVWQPVIRQGLGTRRSQRRVTFHSILGVSMGAAGAGMIGMRNPERFDAIIPLGGPVDWNYLTHYIRNYHVGGFCTAAERARDPMGCAAGARSERTPPLRDMLEFRQNFEEWFYPDGWDGQGGTFDRRSYVQIFRDLTRMFGNAIVPSGDTGVLPRGVPDSELTRTDAQRCAEPVTVMGWYDREYNPDGSLPVRTFCDGIDRSDNRGAWDGSRGNFPMEVSLYVDVNNNSQRDAGEPILRQFYEPFQDVGTDGVPSAMEAGYDPVTNPDPAGDDYDRQFNPGGTEGNYVYNMGEPYEDLGVDGVACPAGRMCPYDLGEGNGRWDITPGGQRFLDVNPRNVAARAPSEALERLSIWTDGGTKDLFLFGVISSHFAGAFAQRGQSLHYFNNFTAFSGERQPEAMFQHDIVDWARMPARVMFRYGDPDAAEPALVGGDGGHVGTIPQVTGRLFTSLYWMQSRWPGGDLSPQRFDSTPDNAGRCANGYFCTFDYTSMRANRTGPVSVYLPPGYHDPANAGRRYPVVYFLHGYGQQPQDLVATGLLVANFMVNRSLPAWRRPQKFIMVFPDGRCRPQDNCFRGTFYADSPVRNAQMETYFLDLYDFIDRTYRVRQPETVEVVE